ncbi:head GIN domain-containing protein [Thalassobellus suaedae]|uniref:Head GIN domain-containing protein n=1 Tax=Thalassobellus suaedae TaxID=3074124 RepID=A0ABY9Y7I4_9FLAO|nr:head GIN domain-containing protein [Flavobacteriaceae bacterium HL-DH10]
MKTLVKVFILFITTVIFAQNPIEKAVGDFSELKVYDLIEVELVKSNDNKVIITGENKADVIINNKNGTLKIKMKLEEAFDGNKTKIVLHYTALDVIDVNEGAKVLSDDTIKQFEIDLRAQEGGKINVPVNVTYTNIKAVTGGIITVTGKSKNQNISISTGGTYQGSEFKTDKTEVNIKAAGEAHVNASKLVDVKIRAGGDVFIYGNPETVNESKVLGGRIKRMNE